MKKTVKFNKEDMKLKLEKFPYLVVWILMIILPPIGVWIFFLKKSNDKANIYNKSRMLTGIGIFIIFLITVGVYSKIKEIIVLYESGMSLDMISVIPEDLWMYIIGIIICISFMIGGKKLIRRARIEQCYTRFINIDKEESIKTIAEKLNVSLDDAKENINKLNNCGYLVSLKIDNKKNKIIYMLGNKENKTTKSLTKKQAVNKKIQCTRCGALVSLKLDEYVECDFCGHGLIDGDNN